MLRLRRFRFLAADDGFCLIIAKVQDRINFLYMILLVLPKISFFLSLEKCITFRKKKKIKETKPHYTFNLEMIIGYDSRLIRKKAKRAKKLEQEKQNMKKSFKNRGGKSQLGF